MDSKSIMPHKEIPFPWTIAREGSDKGPDKFYGLHTTSGRETERYPTYDDVLMVVEGLDKAHKLAERGMEV